MLESLLDALKQVFSGEDTSPELEEGYFGDFNIGMRFEDDAVAIGSDEDMDFFGGDGDVECDYVLCTNIFSMEEERDYYLYIDDLFGQDEESSKLFIDLKKVFVDEIKACLNEKRNCTTVPFL